MILTCRNQYRSEKLLVNQNQLDYIEQVVKFYQKITNYQPTPQISLHDMANSIGVKNIFVKDESSRLGLDSFKVLGSLYAVANIIAEYLGEDLSQLDEQELQSRKVKERVGHLTFVTATDGNHGKGLAYAANFFGHNAVVYLPKGSDNDRVKAVEQAGGKAYVTEANYDDTVIFASQKAQEEGWILVQDTAFDSYTKIPGWIMEGYSMIAKEIVDYFNAQESSQFPTHLIIQAGVGSLAGGVLDYLVNRLGEQIPNIIVVEPENAACMLNSALEEGGTAKRIFGDLDTIMTGLSCGAPNPLGWKGIKDATNTFISVPDWVAARGLRILHNPHGRDPIVQAGFSGSPGIGLLSLFEFDHFTGLKDWLEIDEESVVLTINTESVTDHGNYKSVMWDGHPCTPVNGDFDWKALL
ncbi:diaminopropionate ammonia-lyase [Natranaerobius thermophilus]|uniref:Diaminopropionate ammonia-lyase n=1 Tax=Natranaerobius thermophilus (strain ATCC BAA-1301 / DSM 18059 / JW/NM-WN-LF) TaxID=457570 RepID=B2A6V3_NATTJ|nr:diaminopropionate ammonia-lyase [Natranaerobius thermophilus]ACB84234.1 diaminopropionate ammonia-lyase [Natranaerobius thermophilus JW/NM-WN-LF]